MCIQNSQLLNLVGDEDLLYYIHNILKEKKITTEAYADLFCLLHSRETAPDDKIGYDAKTKTWLRGDKMITDAKLFGLLDDTCEIITQYVTSAWEESLFSAWMSDKPLKRTQKAMMSMESLGSLQAILERVSELLEYGESEHNEGDGIGWEDEPEDGASDTAEELDSEEE